MKIWGLIVLLVVLLGPPRIHAQVGGGLSLSRHALGGGGRSSGGALEVTGTIGQLDAMPPATGGSYSFRGGIWPRPVAEVCDNCADDDGNGLVDRPDPGCAPLADGGGNGVPEHGAVLVACRKAIDHAGLRYATEVQTRLSRCAAAVFTCVQIKPGDEKCLARARRGCEQAQALSVAAARLSQDLADGCSAVGIDELRASVGLGYGAEVSTCRAIGVGLLDSPSSVVACVSAKHGCHAVQAFARAMPRARELLTIGGVDPGFVTCLETGADGGGAGLGPPSSQLAARCQKAVVTAGTKLMATTLRSVQRCTATVFACVQKKPGDAKCLARAKGLCSRDVAPVFAGSAKEARTFQEKVGKACRDVPLSALLDGAGLGFGSLASACGRLGIQKLGSIADVAQCLARHAVCGTRQLARIESPRTRELLLLGGVTEP